MLKHRILTALVLVPLVLLGILYASPWFLGAIITLFVILAGWEWTQLIPLRTKIAKILFIVLLLFALACCARLSYVSQFWLMFGLGLWGVIVIAILTFPKSQSLWGHRLIVGGACCVLLPLFANTFAYVYMQAQGKGLIIYLLCFVWATDTGAYFAGKYWGDRKLIPAVSPGKTIAGAVGGFLLAMLVAAIAYRYFHPSSAIIWFVTNIVTAVISMFGDLFISMLKRRTHLKDTGRIFPGHGGILDRIDSLIAAFPFFYGGLMFL